MDNFSLTAAVEKYYSGKIFNYTLYYDNDDSRDLTLETIPSIICAVCIFGLLGNGTVIWLLGFRMKGNPFTTYALNLAVADFGILISSLVLIIVEIEIPHYYYWPYWSYYMRTYLWYFAYSTSQFLLTAISFDRCVSVLFPIWYQCQCPEKFSTVVCAVIWILSFLQGIDLAIKRIYKPFSSFSRFTVILVNSVVCLTSITVATLILFVKFCFKSQQCKHGRLLMAILLMLFFFLIHAFPINVIYLIQYNPMSSVKDRLTISSYNDINYSILCASLNSFVNPLLYFLVGRKKRGLYGENLKLILQRVFMEEEEACIEEPGIQL